MKRIVLLIVFLGLVGAGFWGHSIYQKGFKPNVKLDEESVVFFVKPNYSVQTVADTLEKNNWLNSKEAFLYWAEVKKLKGEIKPGRYVLQNGTTNNTLVNKLLAGSQTPLNVTLHDITDIYDLSGTLSRYLMPDSMVFLSYFKNDSALAEFGLNEGTLTSLFIPNTYEFYWTSSPKAVLKRMQREYDKFWTPERKRKAEKEGLTRLEVITLASIVEKETVQPDEKPTVARLYLNRLQQGIKMESDPTVIYGINLDYPKRRITRVLYKDLEYDSPYNTYQNKGLPPGPIKIPAKSSIEAVLNAPQHEYIFMVADPKRPGYHSFAENYRQHLVNVAAYRKGR